MVVISEKSHAEYYREQLMPQSSDAQTAKLQSGAANNPVQPDFTSPKAESFWSKVNGKLTFWLRKRAD